MTCGWHVFRESYYILVLVDDHLVTFPFLIDKVVTILLSRSEH